MTGLAPVMLSLTLVGLNGLVPVMSYVRLPHILM